MNKFVCFICTENYDLEERKPKRIKCGDVFCSTCLQYMIKDKKIVTCPNDTSEYSNDLSTISEAAGIIEYLTRNQLTCYSHLTRANGFNIKTFKPICFKCNKKSAIINTIPSIISTQYFFKYIKNKNLLSKEMRLYVKSNMNETLKKKLRTIYMIRLYCTKTKECLVHPNKVRNL